MNRSASLPKAPGAFALVHRASKKAYVGVGKNVRHRADMWDYHLKMADEKPDYKIPARNFPRFPSGEWEFVYLGDPFDEADLRASLAKHGFELINNKSRQYGKRYVIQNIEASLAEHANRLGVDMRLAYRRLERGWTALQALGLAPVDAPDEREHRIKRMAIKITTDDGGYLTYDEAVQMNPSLGDIRRHMAKLRKANPDLTEIKLSGIYLTR